MASPIDDTVVSLSNLSPARQIPATAWQVYVSFGWGRIQYGMEQERNPCIRSLRQRLQSEASLQIDNGLGVMATVSRKQERTESTGFPYPGAYNKVMLTSNQTPRPDEEDGALYNENQARQESTGEPEAERNEWTTSKVARQGIAIETRVFGAMRLRTSDLKVPIQPTYIVLGLFISGSPNPKERIVFVEKPDRIFSKLRWEIFRIRGIRGFFLSLKHLKGFRLYKCDAETGIHKRITLDDNGVGDLQLLMSTYRQWHVPRHVSLAWSDWIHSTLNKSSLDVREGEYGLELVLDWSVTRISVVVLVPVLLSLAIGIWLNSKAWTDLATIQTAWGTASYIVTAGALLAAMLGFLDIADK